MEGMGADDRDGGPWTEVIYQKNRHGRDNGVELTFIVQNLPDRATRMMLRRAFQPFGFVSDAYVARKKDKKGNFFGFVRYKGVENVEMTLAEMNTVKILEAKVTVSLAKYDKNHKQFIYTSKIIGEKAWRPKDSSNMAPPNRYGAFNKSVTTQAGRSFASLFKNDDQVQHSDAKVVEVKVKGSKYPLHCMNRSIHGVLKELGSLKSLEITLSRRGLNNFGLSYVGGLNVLLTLGNPELVREVMANFSAVLSDVFSAFNVWRGDEIPADRVVSLRIAGVPVHLRDNSVYDMIGGLFGKVVQESSFSWSVSDNSEGSVLVLVPLGRRIEESVVINWQEKRFVVWVAEDVMAWKPDMSGDSCSVGEDPGSSSSEEPDNVSVAGGDEEVVNMVDEVEEGEIRSPVRKSPVPEECSRPPSDPPSDPVIDRSPLRVNLDAEKSRDMFVDIEEPVSIGVHGLHGEHDVSIPEILAANLNGSGPRAKGVNNNHIVDHSAKDGPTPLTGLGKRNRADRSPPSSGSQQGPPLKSFFQDPTPEDISFDLNRPSLSAENSAGGEILGEQLGESILRPSSSTVAVDKDLVSVSRVPNLNSNRPPDPDDSIPAQLEMESEVRATLEIRYSW
ncbi:putative RNA recognition motif domain, nucleotide-binding alpha-beta plait domain superfamily [Helianthus annuus]|nr:putative RNA recognition motif domain, nucleotide-binding alpha-beta plait domain superfamily [Helianthus annuus]